MSCLKNSALNEQQPTVLNVLFPSNYLLQLPKTDPIRKLQMAWFMPAEMQMAWGCSKLQMKLFISLFLQNFKLNLLPI